MYTSFYTQAGHSSNGFKAAKANPGGRPVPTKEDLMLTNTTLQVGQRIMGGRAVIRAILSETSFVLFHEDFRQEFMARKIADDEDINDWVNLQQHSNIVTAFDKFFEEKTGWWYAMVELTNAGNMYQYIASLNLNLGIDVSKEYRERIYDVAIQLATALDFAHNARLVHGKLDLSAIVIDKEGKNLVFKI